MNNMRNWTKYGLDSTPSQVALIILFLGVLLIHHHVVTVSYVYLCLWALIGPKQAIKALSLNYLILILNPSLYETSPEVGLFRWVILFIAGLRIFPSFSHRATGLIISLLLFFLTVTVLAFLTSPNFHISFAKIIAFTYGAATFLIAFNSLGDHSLLELKKWFLAISIAVIIFSLPTLLIYNVGYHRNGVSFQGILNHPQAFGVFLVPTASYVAAKIFFVCKSGNLWLCLYGVIAFILMFLSRCRTALLAVLMSLGFALAIGVGSNRQIMKMAPSRNLVYIASGLIVIFTLIVFSPTVSKTIEGFWKKGEETLTIEESFYESRGVGIAFFWQRFLQKPMTGHGFGIDVAHGIPKNPKSFLGIPISFSTEKGFLPVAFLEEVGIVGLIFFLPFFFILCRKAVKQSDIGLISMFFSCLFVNIGEAVFFSPGYLGGYLWLLIGLSTAPGWKISQVT